MCDELMTVYCATCKKHVEVEIPKGCYCDEDQGA